MGYPKGIVRSSDKGKRQNFLLSHVWRFNYVIKRLTEVAEEYGISVVVVNEAFTSQTCPLCGQRHSGGRIFRGLFKCRGEGVVMNADLVGALNILKEVVKTMTPSLPALSGGRGNGGKTLPEGSKTRFILGLNETLKPPCPWVRGFLVGTLALHGGEEVRFITKEVRDLLKKYVERYNSERNNLVISYFSLEKPFIRKEELSNQPVRPKHMRKFFSQEWDRRNGNATGKKLLMGHSIRGDINALHYSHHTPESLQRVYDKVFKN